jgi:hypothetical protein
VEVCRSFHLLTAVPILCRSDGVSFDWELPSDDEPEMQVDINPGSLIPMKDYEAHFLKFPSASVQDTLRHGSLQRDLMTPNNSGQELINQPNIEDNVISIATNTGFHVKAEPDDDMAALLSSISPCVGPRTEEPQANVVGSKGSTSNYSESIQQEDPTPVQETIPWNSVPPVHLPTTLSTIAICFLDR